MNNLKLILTTFLMTIAFFKTSFSQSDTSLIRIGKEQYDAGKYKKALQTYIKATEVNPNSALAYRLVGETYFRILKLDESINAFKKSIQIDSTDNKALMCLGIAQARQYTKTKDPSILAQSDSVYKKTISKNYEVPYVYMLMAYNNYYRKDFDKTWDYIFIVKKLDEKYLDMRFVVDLYSEHPDANNVFNIKTTPNR
jgi:tetratricopeptide (TPR) repeat protein